MKKSFSSSSGSFGGLSSFSLDDISIKSSSNSPTNFSAKNKSSTSHSTLRHSATEPNLSHITNTSGAIEDSIGDDELSRFTVFCGMNSRTRKYGKGEIEGIILNLRDNRFLKTTTSGTHKPPKTVSEAFSATREAFFVDIDPQAENKRERDLRIIATYPNQDKTLFRVKDIKYGNHNAMWEVLSSHLYALTGLTAPNNRILVHSDLGKRENGMPKVFVASPIISGYSDLGDFLISENVNRFIGEETHERLNSLKAEIVKINQQSQVTAEDKLKRVNLFSQIYEMLPTYFHTEIEKSFAASKFIANWDFANFNLNNIGCRFTLDRDGNIIGFESVFVDFGNSGAIGFKGLYKEESLSHANQAAKKQSDSPNDFDPEIKDTQKILPQEASLKIDTETTSFLSFSDLPRKFPFAPIIALATKDKSEVAQQNPYELKHNSEFYRNSEIEVAFRLSLISDEAIRKVTQKWFLSDDFPQIFPIPEKFLDDAKYNSTEAVAQIFIDRKNALVQSIPAEIINNWVNSHRVEATTAQREVALAIIRQTSNINYDFDFENDCKIDLAKHPRIGIVFENNFENRLHASDNNSPILQSSVILQEIEQRQKENIETFEKQRSQDLRNFSILLKNSQNNPELEEFLKRNIANIEHEIQYKALDLTVQFIEKEVTKWNAALGIETLPNCNFFDLHLLRSTYRATNFQEEDRQETLSTEENLQRSLKLFEENNFIYKYITSALQKITIQKNPKTVTVVTDSDSLKPQSITQEVCQK